MPRFAIALAIGLLAPVCVFAQAQPPALRDNASAQWQGEDSGRPDAMNEPMPGSTRPKPPAKLSFDTAAPLVADLADGPEPDSSTVQDAPPGGIHPPTAVVYSSGVEQAGQPPNQLAVYDAPLPSADANSPINLPPRRETSLTDLAPPGKGTSSRDMYKGVSSSLVTVLGSLAIVLGLFFLVVWLMRRGMPKAARILPTEAVEVLGRAPLPGKQQMHLVRCGPKILLLSVSATGAETLTEITDPDEVARMIALCYRSQPGSATATFRDVMDQFGRERSTQEGLAQRIRSTGDHGSAPASAV